MTTTVTAETLAAWPLPEPDASDKYSRGLALVVGGSAQTPGAALLAAEAALRVGCGKVRIATVASVAPHLAVALPEARVLGFDDTSAGNLSTVAADDLAELASSADAVLIGSGLVDPDEAREIVGALVPSITCPVVLDALGTAYVGKDRSLGDVEGPCVLTLNPSELADVLGVDQVDDPRGGAERLAAESGAVVLLGGDTKYVAGPGSEVFEITTGDVGLATAGSGDVQAGLVVGLLARGADPVQAAVWAAWLHGRAGDRLTDSVGRLGFVARELAAEVPRLLQEPGQGMRSP